VDEGLGAKKQSRVVFFSGLVGFILEISRLQKFGSEGANP
jgi:hypothetical protein